MIKKINCIMLSVLFVAVAGFTIAPFACATTSDGLGATTYKTEKLYFKKDPYQFNDLSFRKSLPDKNGIYGGYDYKPNWMYIILDRGDHGDYLKPTYRITVADVTFKKTVNGQTSYSTKTLKPYYWSSGQSWIEYTPKNNYKPYYAVISYQKK